MRLGAVAGCRAVSQRGELVSAMDSRSKRQILKHRIELLKGHIEQVGESTPGFERELQKAEAELRDSDEPSDADTAR